MTMNQITQRGLSAHMVIWLLNMQCKVFFQSNQMFIALVYSFWRSLVGRRLVPTTTMSFLSHLLGYAWKLWHENNLIELMEPAIRESCSLGEVVICVTIASLCVQDYVNDRPTMSSVLIMLESGTTSSLSPKQSSFSAVRGPTNTDSSTFELANASITVFTGR